jgi:hypothetical protein
MGPNGDRGCGDLFAMKGMIERRKDDTSCDYLMSQLVTSRYIISNPTKFAPQVIHVNSHIS